MVYLLTYDISNDRLRTKIAKRIIAEGYERLQFSVFVGLGSPKTNKPLWADLHKWLEVEPTAKLYVVPVTNNNLRNMVILGKNGLDIGYLLGNRNTMFI
jgi:CRISPR-associated protein Cas2